MKKIIAIICSICLSLGTMVVFADSVSNDGDISVCPWNVNYTMPETTQSPTTVTPTTVAPTVVPTTKEETTSIVVNPTSFDTTTSEITSIDDANITTSTSPTTTSSIEKPTTSNTETPTANNVTTVYTTNCVTTVNRNITGTVKVTDSISTGKKIKNTYVKKAIRSKKSLKIVSVTLKKVKNISGYQVKISSSKKFKNKKKVITRSYRKNKFKYKKLSYLPSKKYYIKARTYIIAGKKRIYGKWSKAKKVKLK